jgi:hypothetical protein
MSLKGEAGKVFTGLSEWELFEFLTQFTSPALPFELYPRLLTLTISGEGEEVGYEIREFNPLTLEFEQEIEVKDVQSTPPSQIFPIPGSEDFYATDRSRTLTRWRADKYETFSPLDVTGILDANFRPEFSLPDESLVISTSERYFRVFPDLNNLEMAAIAKLHFSFSGRSAWQLDDDKVFVSDSKNFQICSLETYKLLGEGQDLLGVNEQIVKISNNLFVSSSGSSVYAWRFDKEKSDRDTKQRPEGHFQSPLLVITGFFAGALPGLILIDKGKQGVSLYEKREGFEEVQKLESGRYSGFGDSFFTHLDSEGHFLKKGLYGIKKLKGYTEGFALPPGRGQKREMTKKLLVLTPLAKSLVEVLVEFMAPVTFWNSKTQM